MKYLALNYSLNFSLWQNFILKVDKFSSLSIICLHAPSQCEKYSVYILPNSLIAFTFV